MSNWLKADDFAQVAGISPRKARRALSLAKGGQVWRGNSLEVRTVPGRGGHSGLQYQVKVSSLPPHLQERLKARQITAEVALRFRLGDDSARFERAWKHEIISAALAHPKGSAARKAEIDKIHGQSKLDWTGRSRRLTRTTLYSWIDIYDREGIYGLAQKVRRDRGNKKVVISRAWMNAVPFTEEVMRTIQHDLKQYVRSLIKEGSQPKQTRVLVGEKLKEMTAAYRFTIENPSIFDIPRTFVEEEYHYKAVYRHNTDRKASHDAAPRIRRGYDLQPMEVVVADVHHINVLVAREDGTHSTPKLIAFHDLGTNRVFCEFIQFDSRGGVRNSDVITAFVNMCQHPAFGVPQFLYVDNGSEYGFADDLEDALRLGTKVIPFEGQEERNRIIRSITYNAAAKPVEGFFRQLNQQYLRHVQGWIDDDRMNPKRPELGKLPAPFSDGFDAFCRTVFGLLTAYENMPQNSRTTKGRSPAETFRAHVEAGWRATVLDPGQLLTVFTRPETRVVDRHGISVNDWPWTCDGLLEFFGRKVIAHIPKYHGFGELLITDEHGAEIGIAVADREYGVLDHRGARESARRKSIRNKALTQLDRSVPSIDVGAELIAYGKKHLPVTPNEPDATISVSRPGSERRAILPVEAERASRKQQDEELRQRNRAESEIYKQMLRPKENKQ